MLHDRDYEHISNSGETWVSIISLADRWQFESMGRAAFAAYANLEEVSALDKVMTCEKYGFDRQVAFKAYWLVSWEKPLQFGRAEQIGWKASVLISRARDSSRAKISIGERQQALKDDMKELKEYKGLLGYIDQPVQDCVSS